MLSISIWSFSYSDLSHWKLYF